MTDMLNVTVYDGKYTVIQNADGLRALRYGEEWRDCVGDGLVLALAQEVEGLRELVAEHDKAVTLDDPGITLTAEFHHAFDCAILPEPALPDLDAADRIVVATWASRLALFAQELKAEAARANAMGRPALGLVLVRMQLMTEEPAEVFEAVSQGDLPAVLHELADCSYVVDGTYHTFGLGAVKLAASREVHRANMSKLGADGRPIHSPAGRVVKGPNFAPADMVAVLESRAGGA